MSIPLFFTFLTYSYLFAHRCWCWLLLIFFAVVNKIPLQKHSTSKSHRTVSMLALRSNRNALRVAPAKVSLQERRAASNACAIAVLGGRFQTVPEAMRHPDFADATRSPG